MTGCLSDLAISIDGVIIKSLVKGLHSGNLGTNTQSWQNNSRGIMPQLQNYKIPTKQKNKEPPTILTHSQLSHLPNYWLPTAHCPQSSPAHRQRPTAHILHLPTAHRLLPTFLQRPTANGPPPTFFTCLPLTAYYPQSPLPATCSIIKP